MPTLEDTFHVFIIVTDEEFKEVIRGQVGTIKDESMEPIGEFDFDSAIKMMHDLREAALTMNEDL